MVYHGHVKDGKVVLEEQVALPEGSAVRVEVIKVDITAEHNEGKPGSIREVLLKHAGSVAGLPADGARQHDHYLYGAPKHE